MENFDRMVFESVVERIIIGGYNDEGAVSYTHLDVYKRQGLGEFSKFSATLSACEN